MIGNQPNSSTLLLDPRKMGWENNIWIGISKCLLFPSGLHWITLSRCSSSLSSWKSFKKIPNFFFFFFLLTSIFNIACSWRLLIFCATGEFSNSVRSRDSSFLFILFLLLFSFSSLFLSSSKSSSSLHIFSTVKKKKKFQSIYDYLSSVALTRWRRKFHWHDFITKGCVFDSVFGSGMDVKLI